MVRIASQNDINRITEIELFVNRYNFKNILPYDSLYNKLSYEYIKDWFTGSFDDMENERGIEEKMFSKDWNINILKLCKKI